LVRQRVLAQPLQEPPRGPARLGGALSCSGRFTVSSTIPGGTGSKTKAGATLFGRWSARIASIALLWSFRAGEHQGLLLGVSVIPAIAAAASSISG